MNPVLPIEDLDKFILDLVTNIKRGVYEAGQANGVMMDMPEEISIEATLISKPQHLPVRKTSTRTESGMQGGSTVEHGQSDETSRTTGQTTQQTLGRTEETGKTEAHTDGKVEGASNQSQDSSDDTTQDQTSSSTSDDKTVQNSDQISDEGSEGVSNYEYDEKG